MTQLQYGFTVNLTCVYEKCTNAGRYIDDQGRICCGSCPASSGIDAIRLADVPKLLLWARRLQAELMSQGIDKFKDTDVADLSYDRGDYIELVEIIGQPRK